MGRARAGRSMAWDPRGTASAGGTLSFHDIDIVSAMAAKNKAAVEQGTKAAMLAEHYDGIKLSENGTTELDYALAQMSKVCASANEDSYGKVITAVPPCMPTPAACLDDEPARRQPHQTALRMRDHDL